MDSRRVMARTVPAKRAVLRLVAPLLLASAVAASALEIRDPVRESGLEPVKKSASSADPAPPSPLAVGEDPSPFTEDPSAGGIEITGTDESLAPFSYVGVTFSEPVVSADKIDAPDQQSPIVIWPEIATEFTWRTQSGGDLVIKGPVIPGQEYHLRLRDGLTALSGSPLPVKEWGAVMHSPAFRVTGEFSGPRDRVNAQTQVYVEFNYPLQLASATTGAWFQNRKTRARYPAEILLNYPDGRLDPKEPAVAAPPGEPLPDKIYAVRYRPAAPLPMGGVYDFVVEGATDAYAGRGLAYPVVFPLGPTLPLEIDYVAARTRPLEKPHIEIKFDQFLDDKPLPPDALKIEPQVSGLTVRKEGAYIIAEGDFQVPGKYAVSISDKFAGYGGYGLAKPEKWGATFRPSAPAVVFPSRTIRQRPSLGFNFAFYQVNTGALEWRLSRIPEELLPAISGRLREFDQTKIGPDGNPVWGKDGYLEQAPTSLLTKDFDLEAVATGQIPESAGETLRNISWKPEVTGALSGPMLFEIVGRAADGRFVGNRAVVLFGDYAITRKKAPAADTFRVASMADAKPVAGAELTLLDKNGVSVARAVTGKEGEATFAGTDAARAESVVADILGERVLQPFDLADRFSGASGYVPTIPRFASFTFTDRPLYRPGQTVHFKGFVRERTAAGLSIPKGAISWEIRKPYTREVDASGNATISPDGGWSGEWTPPEGFGLGDFVVEAKYAGASLEPPARFQIEEFRNPPFSVVAEAGDAPAPGESAISVASQYFHGAPNIGAKVVWKATWYGDSEDGFYIEPEDDNMIRVDLFSEKAPRPTLFAEVSGETFLDGNGKAELRCAAPFADPGNRANASVYWRVDITGPDGQTIPGGTQQGVSMLPVQLGIKAGEAADGKLHFVWDAKEPFSKKPQKVSAELFRVTTKSVKERLAPGVYRFRNFDVYTPAGKIDKLGAADFTFDAKEPGRYVAILVPPANSGAIPVSDEIYLPGEGESEPPIETETGARVLEVSARRGDKEAWKIGETLALDVISPTPGIAWVSVETDRILDTFTFPLDGNTSRIEIPVKPEYEPNAFVTVYLLRPGGDSALAGEMFGYAPIAVESPERALAVQVAIDQSEVQPREPVSGKVSVSAAGKPVEGADLAIYAVDDSILTLGGWSLPSGIIARFFPERAHAVATFTALRDFVDKISPSWLTSKGFVVGGGGEDEVANTTFTRKEFKPLILWVPSVKTGPDGSAAFRCDAPDNLTRFRVIAVAQTRANQFGAGDSTFTVSKKLIVEPALPRFVRSGDTVELRAVVRQKTEPNAQVSVRCSTGGGLVLEGPSEAAASADKDAPAVVTFRAKASAEGPASVKFEASSGQLADAVEVTLPVETPVVTVKESVSVPEANFPFKPAEYAPAGWASSEGVFSVSVSSTPWLAKLSGIPSVVEYPFGCLEQKSARLLVYTQLAKLLAYVPDSGLRAEKFGATIEETLREFEAAQLPMGTLPYWQGGTVENLFVTLQAAWCVDAAASAGFDVPERLYERLGIAVKNLLEDRLRGTTPTLRAFAAFLAANAPEPGVSPEILDELYLVRDRLTDEGKAWLALAYNALKANPDAQRQLVSELPTDFGGAFNPDTFSSPTRRQALCTWARLAIDPSADVKALRGSLEKLMLSSASLSTQENLWLLVAFNALVESSPKAPLPGGLKPKPETYSENKTAAAWAPAPLAALASSSITASKPLASPGSALMSATYRPASTEAVSRGIRLDRSAKNLTDPMRDGSAAAPFKLGDQVLLIYRFSSQNPQNFLALEDLIPAGLEVVNPNLALFGKTMQMPGDAGSSSADLSHQELRDSRMVLFFDSAPSGVLTYSVLARATAAGSFAWPAAQIAPMYDSRFGARTAPASLQVTE